MQFTFAHNNINVIDLQKSTWVEVLPAKR
jgi:hypothetical protein